MLSIPWVIIEYSRGSIKLIYEKPLRYCLAYDILLLPRKNLYLLFSRFHSKNSFLIDLYRINHSHLRVTTVFLLISSFFPAAFLTWLSLSLHNELPEGKITFHTVCIPAKKWCAMRTLHQWLSFLAAWQDHWG